MLSIRKIIRSIIAIPLAVLLQGCNADAFIEEFLKGHPEVEITVGQTAALPFEHEDWRILRIRQAATKDDCPGKLYDLGENLIYTDNIAQVEGLVKFEHSSPGLRFSILRSDYRRLEFTLETTTAPSTIEVVVGNHWARKIIPLSLLPASPEKEVSCE